VRISRKRGFTLIEMLTVIVVIMLLAGLLVPTVMTAKKRAEMTVCGRNLSAIGTAMTMYTSDWNGRYPTLTGARLITQKLDSPWFELLRPYGIDGKAWKCPSDEGFDPDRYTRSEQTQLRLIYRADNICYGLNYDTKDAAGNPYRVMLTGGWQGSSPDGIPDTLSVSDVMAAKQTLIVGESDGDGQEDFAIDLTGLRRIGAKHGGSENVFFLDGHVEKKPVKPEVGRDINMDYKLWTLYPD